MRVLFFNYEYPPLGGGAANATSYILREFAKIPGLEVDLVTSSVDDRYHLEKIGGNINIYKLPIGKNEKNFHFQTQKDLLAYSWKAYFFSRKLIKENKYDLTHSFFTVPCGFLSMVHYWLYKIPYVVSLRGSDVPFYNARFKWLDKIFFRKLAKIIWRRARYVVSLSDDLINLARKTSKKQKISVIYNGINSEEFYPDKSVLDNEKTFNIFSVGRLIERKGLIFLLEAFKNISQKYPEARLLVAGDGPLKATYEKFVNDNGLNEKVAFFGLIDHSRIAEIYRKCHIFVLPSLNEALGNATHEALASGLPIITTRTGAAEIIGDSGYVIDKKSANQIEAAIEMLIKNPVLRREMAEKSRKLAEEMSWENTAKKYYALYEKINQR